MVAHCKPLILYISILNGTDHGGCIQLFSGAFCWITLGGDGGGGLDTKEIAQLGLENFIPIET